MVSRSSRNTPTTPHEVFHGKKPNLEHIRPFGCLTYVTMPHELRQKLITQMAAYKAIFLGYTESTHHYRVWNMRKSLPRNKRAVKNQWVFKRKLDPDDTTRYKARLVIKGHEQRYGIDFKETFAPVVNSRTVKVLLALAATLDLEIHQMDVKTAFLNGELEEEIYMKYPKGIMTGKPSLRRTRHSSCRSPYIG